MLVFIDKSGDPRIKLDRGASPIFVAAMVIFQTPEAASGAQTTIAGSEARRLHKPREFKFNKCAYEIRDLYFEAIAPCDFSVRAIVVRKEVIFSTRLIADKERFYEYFVKQMMKNDNGALQDAKVTIDGSGDRAFRRDLNAALRLRLRQGVIKKVQFKALQERPATSAGRYVRGRDSTFLPHGSRSARPVATDAPAAYCRCMGIQVMRTRVLSWRNQERAPYGDSSDSGGGLANRI